MGWTIHAAGTEAGADAFARKLLDFDDADLAANREGRLSARQGKRTVRFLLGVGLGWALLAGLWLYTGLDDVRAATSRAVEMPTQGVSARTIVEVRSRSLAAAEAWKLALGQGALLVAMVGVCVYALRRRASLRVAVAEGELRWVDGSPHVGDQEVDFSALVFRAQLEGRRMRVYFLSLTREPLALELLP